MSDEEGAVPTPGRDAAPDEPSDPQANVTVDEESGTVTRAEESGVGPGAGASPIVRVTTPAQHQKEDATRHPTLRDDDLADAHDEDAGAGPEDRTAKGG
jgi:hypothetical protein